MSAEFAGAPVALPLAVWLDQDHPEAPVPGAGSPEVRRRTREQLQRPDFHYVDGLPRDQYREQVWGWLQLIGESGLGALGFPREYGGQDDPGGRLASFETLAHHDLSLLVKVGVQFGLFGGAVLRLGTQRHHERYLPAIGRAELPGCFAMTETGHGSDVRSLRTRATYDPDTDELVVDTPLTSARKDYIGNAACHGRLAVVFAQLHVAGEEHGVHAVLVPLRDEQGELLPGVEVEDDGEKAGLNGVDNGRLSFAAVRVPRTNLLDRFGSIDDDGTYSSPIENPAARFFTMLGALVEGRVSVALAALSVSKSALAIAVRYAERRRQFQAEAAEVPLLDYRTHQRRLLPALARTYALHAALRLLAAEFVAGMSTEPGSVERRRLEGVAAGLKAYTTWHTVDVVQTCREACGGAGYLTENRLGAMRADCDVFTTFEGDNTVLMQLLTKGLLSEYAEQFEDLNLFDMARYATSRASSLLLESSPLSGRGDTSEEFFRSRETYLTSFRWREEHQIAGLARRMRKRLSETDPVTALIDCQDHVVSVAHAHVERLVLERFAAAIDAAQPDAADTLERLLLLFGADRMWQDRGWFIEHGQLSTAQSKALGTAVNVFCAELRPAALALVDAFAIPDAVLAAPIAVGEPS